MHLTLPLAIVGVDFRRASTRWRAAMSLDAPGRKEMHTALVAQGASAFAELATCNRTEWVAVGHDPDWLAALLRAQAIERLAAVEPNTPFPYTFVGDDAARHLLRVSLGQESLARGEAHIARQAHDAFARAREEGTACSVLNVVETVVGHTVRRAGRGRRAAGRGMHRVVAEALAAHGIAGNEPVLVVGMGAIGRRVADVVARRHPVVRVNRTPAAGVLALDEAMRTPPLHAAVALCSAAPEPVWTTAQLRPETRLVVDIGSPPQAAPDVRERVAVVDLDTLVASLEAPTDADTTTDAVVEAGLDDLRRALGVRALRDLVRSSRERYTDLDRAALDRILQDEG